MSTVKAKVVDSNSKWESIRSQWLRKDIKDSPTSQKRTEVK